MSPKTPIRVLLLSSSLVSGLALAGVHKCLDENQKIVYQDKPCQELTAAGLSPALSRLNPEENRPHLLWKMSDEQKTVYIMGSLGYGTADMYPLPEAIMDIFSEANVLAIVKELDAGGNAASHAAVMAKGSYSDGSSLSNHVKPATWQRALDLAKTLNVTEEALGAQKPWMAALTLKNAALKQAGYDETLNIAKAFAKAAQAAKPVVEIDGLDEQVEHFNGMPDAEQEQFLLEALHEADNKNEYFSSLIDAWKKGDADSVDLVVRRALDSLPPSQKSLQERLIARNEAIAKKIGEMAADGKIYFMVVDAKCLVGEKGILAMLQSKGFKASQL
jgi:uncharacterized protein YbaP (TraB family)